MAPSPTTRRAALGATVVASIAVLTAAGLAAAPSSNAASPSAGLAAAAAPCGELFDDFNYSSNNDPNLAARGWSIRTGAGGPGVPGASWPRNNVTFQAIDATNRAVQLAASTGGAGSNTTQSEFSQSQRRFFEGTYSARIRFSDAPVSGADGDHVNQTFYTISPLARPMDPTYSELDFSEYLPNGGWGEPAATNFQTTWYTYQADPWVADNQSSRQVGSIAGWRDVTATVAGGHVRYYIDGRLVGDHSGKFYPRQLMSIDFNHWFIDTLGHSGGISTYVEQVDYVYHAKNEVISAADVAARAQAFRGAGVTHRDNVQAGACTPTNPSPTPTASNSPTPRPTPTSGPCPTPAWSPTAIYTLNMTVSYAGRIWRAKWWTQNETPGTTGQWGVWEDRGPCS